MPIFKNRQHNFFDWLENKIRIKPSTGFFFFDEHLLDNINRGNIER